MTDPVFLIVPAWLIWIILAICILTLVQGFMNLYSEHLSRKLQKMRQKNSGAERVNLPESWPRK